MGRISEPTGSLASVVHATHFHLKHLITVLGLLALWGVNVAHAAQPEQHNNS